MKTIAFITCALLLGITIGLTIDAAQRFTIQEDSLRTTTVSAFRAASQATRVASHEITLTLQAVVPEDLSSAPSVLDGAPALPVPPQ